jgi:hypothetical protein
MRLAMSVVVAVLATACGSAEPGARAERYGISLDVPEGWYGEITRGTVRLGTVPAGTRLGDGDVAVVLFEHELMPFELHQPASPNDDWPPRFTQADIRDPDTRGAVDSGDAPGRRLVAVNGRRFNVFVESGSRSVSEQRLAELNEALAAIEVGRGDFYNGSAPPVEFPPRRGWHVVSSGPSPRYAGGEYTQSAAATIPYRNDANDLPPARTLEALPRDGILVWVGLTRDARFPASDWDRGEAFEPRRPPPYRLEDLERFYPWEGQVRDIPEYRLWAAAGDQYLVDLRIYFGQEHPTAAMRAEADAVLRGLSWPDWGPWELETA